MSQTAEKTWTADLTDEDVEWGREQAQRIAETHEEAVENVLALAQHFSEARQRFKPKGVFTEWVREETGYSYNAAYQLAQVGDIAPTLNAFKVKLPSSWGSLYELSKADPEVRDEALNEIHQSMTRKEVNRHLQQARRGRTPTVPDDSEDHKRRGHPKHDPVPYTTLKRRKGAFILSQWENCIDHPPSVRVWPHEEGGKRYPICTYIAHELDPERLWAFVEPAARRKDTIWEIHYVADEESLSRARRRFRQEVSATARDVREIVLEEQGSDPGHLACSDIVRRVIPWAARTEVHVVGRAIYELAHDLGFVRREDMSTEAGLVWRHVLPRVLDHLTPEQAEETYQRLALRVDQGQVPEASGTGTFEPEVVTAIGARERRALQGMIPEEWCYSIHSLDPRK